MVGAGIGGLTAAVALRQVGLDVRVYERAPELREVGAGIQASPNATRILDLARTRPAPSLAVAGVPGVDGRREAGVTRT